MNPILTPPAEYIWSFFPTVVFSALIPVVGTCIFAYLMALRMAPLVKATADQRTNNVLARFKQVLSIWLFQMRQPRYMVAGVLHIIIFGGFLVLGIRSISLVVIGLDAGFVFPGLSGPAGHIYNVLKDYAATLVLGACLIAAMRRGIFKPERYEVPAKYGDSHTGEAIFVLLLICVLMLSESLFEGSLVAAQAASNTTKTWPAPLSLPWIWSELLQKSPTSALQGLHVISYYLHDLAFFIFLCFLPLGKHFHVITSLFNVFFMRLERGTVKPVRYGITEDQLDELDTFGVQKLEDFTWKHILDFYSCADCGRCSDNCPANAAGRPLSPRFLTIKGRDLTFRNYPVFPYGAPIREGKPLMETIYQPDEIWSCTTCGACEEECPIGIEYIDKIVDLRRGMVEQGAVPQSLQKPLRALEKRGNPWGKLEKKRAKWADELQAACAVPVKRLDNGQAAETIYFVDSISSYDDRMMKVAQATARVLSAADVDFGILGKLEKDSGHEPHRFGEEMLFQALKEENTKSILACGAQRIVTADPHAYNAMSKDYEDLPPVHHISEYIVEALSSGKLEFKQSIINGNVYTFHDPCYLGRHNQLYDTPRKVMDAVPGLKRVEMDRCRDRSFCCGGGGLMLFYEPEEDQRMGVLRVKMAAEAGADTIITACPFCLVNMEDAIKVAGLEGSMAAIDLVELVAEQL
jgi:Fe-S oxidoreductase